MFPKPWLLRDRWYSILRQCYQPLVHHVARHGTLHVHPVLRPFRHVLHEPILRRYKKMSNQRAGLDISDTHRIHLVRPVLHLVHLVRPADLLLKMHRIRRRESSSLRFLWACCWMAC